MNNGDECFDVHGVATSRERGSIVVAVSDTNRKKIETEMKRESVCEQQTTNNCVMARSIAWQCKYGWVREKNAARRPIYL